MAIFHASQIPPPKHWQEFEELCTDLWSARQDTKNTQSHGRTGQRQDGVDIFGQFEHSNEWFGVQCKGKDSRYGSELTEQELLSEVEKAKCFTPKLKMFTLATTAPNDAIIQKVARELTVSHEKQNLFSVEVKSWDEIQREIALYPDIIAKHFPTNNYRTNVNNINSISKKMPPPRYRKSFFGREVELKELIASLEHESLIQICGIGGIGKSELVLQAIKESKSTKNIIWCNIEKYHSIDDLKLALLNIFRTQKEDISIDELPFYFDQINAQLIIDGVEQSNLEELEDIISEWHSETSNCQFIITTQVELYNFSNQSIINLKSLSPSESKLLFMDLYGKQLSKYDYGLDALVEFCDGHALTITFASALTKYYGTTTGAMQAINKYKSKAISIPERERLSRQTSLEICLQTAYESLSLESKKLLWALSECPAGVPTNRFDKEWLGIESTTQLYASLKRWHFIDEVEKGENLTLTRMLTPIRSFVSRKAETDHPEQFEKIILELAQDFLVWIAVIESNFSELHNHGYMMCRYESELPNLTNIIEIALIRESNVQLIEIAAAVASCIMPYYFVLGAPSIGARLLKDVLKLTVKLGLVNKASEVFLQYASLTKRVGSKDLLEEAFELLTEIENMQGIEHISAELSLCKAIAASNDIEYIDDFFAEVHSNKAIEGFKDKIKNLTSNSEEAKFRRSDLRKNLSYSYGLLGTSLLNQGKVKKALEAYYNCLEYQDESIKSTNQGQTLHQIGKCYMQLGNGELAVKYFSRSTSMFLFSGMKEYISHSFSELGYSLLMVDTKKFKYNFSEELTDIALDDLKQCTVQNFDVTYHMEKNSCMYNIRKLLGTYFLLTFIGQGKKLNHFTLDIAETITLHKKVEIESSVLRDRQKYLILVLDKTLELGHAISCVEYEVGNDDLHMHVNYLLKLICELDGVLDHKTFQITEWLAAYLQHLLGSKKIEPERLEKFIYNYNNDIPDTFDPFSD